MRFVYFAFRFRTKQQTIGAGKPAEIVCCFQIRNSEPLPSKRSIHFQSAGHMLRQQLQNMTTRTVDAPIVVPMYDHLIRPTSGTAADSPWQHFGFPASPANRVLTRSCVVCMVCRCALPYNAGDDRIMRAHLRDEHSPLYDDLLAATSKLGKPDNIFTNLKISRLYEPKSLIIDFIHTSNIVLSTTLAKIKSVQTSLTKSKTIYQLRRRPELNAS